MGMLQLAGAVSGAGKGLQQGLQVMQNTMHQDMLLRVRDDMDRARIRLTYDLEDGMLQKKSGYETVARAQEQANRQANIRLQGNIDGGHIVARGEQDRKTYGVKQAGEVAIQGNQIASTEKMHNQELQFKGLQGDKDRKTKLSMQEIEVRSALDQLRMKLDRSETEAKLPPRVAAKLEFLKTKLEGLNKFIASSFDEEAIKTAKREAKTIDREVDHLLDFAQERPTYMYPEDPQASIAKHDKWRGSSPSEGTSSETKTTNLPQAEANLPRFGNVEPTLADLVEFQRQYDEAAKSGGQVASIVEAFKDRFGRIPTQADYDRVRNARH